MPQNAFVGDNTQQRQGGQLGILDVITQKCPNHCKQYFILKKDA